MSDACPKDVEALEELLSRPLPGVEEDLARLDGDVLVLGVGGKMGPTLARMARRALPERRTVTGVARFSSPEARRSLEACGVRTIPCDLLDREAVSRLPEAPLVVFMAGMKFGSTEAPSATWAMNTVVPAWVAERWRSSRLAIFSSGNVYPFVPVGDGAGEAVPPGPVGEYAQSVLGRERVFEFFSSRHRTPGVLVRLNYATEMRYGVLLDVALRVRDGRPIDVSMGYVNVIWQRDANAAALRSLALAASPPRILNVAGPEVLSVRTLAERFGKLLGRAPVLEGREADRALLSDASELRRLYGAPSLPAETLVEWTADWVRRGGETLGKPTHYEARDGKF